MDWAAVRNLKEKTFLIRPVAGISIVGFKRFVSLQFTNASPVFWANYCIPTRGVAAM